ncbi:MAG TPA: AAA family ATPase, partial [Anaerolineae bacterium]|nr:AAA family ATPase [Anaerolineae bacterium]
MVTLPGLTIGTQLYEGKETAVYRAHDDVAGRSVVIKMLKDEYPSAKAVALLRREFELMGVVVADEILGAYDVRQSGSQHYLVLEDFGGEALNKQWARERMPLAEFFVWAGQLVRGLGVLQGANIMHKDIKPHNIIVNRETMVAKIADFGIASQLEREHVMGEGLGIQQLEGTLAYISPEQTGRMNRPLDYRTDIYSLGVTFYEMLAGELPFQDSEAMGMVHSHLAKKPPALRELAPEVTPMLAAIVAKMMAKVAEERYQSAAGLLADLEMCRIEWEAGMEMWTGELGAHDRSGRLQIAAKLYGREAGREKLLEALGTVTGGQTMLVMIAGYAGIGKSALVQELYKPITAQRGYFIRGKFESMQRQRPYSAFVAAWTDWVKQILTTGETEIELWRERLLEALGGAGQVMVDLVPNLALLLGEQAAVPVLDGMEAQKRFQIVVQNFMRGIVDPERPLLLFLDDWQWADGGSWELLRLIVAEGDLPLLVVGSYRSNEVAEDELFAGSWREVEAAARLLEYIQLEPLGVDDVEALVADSFEQTAAAVRLLAELLHQKAGGNPFFTNELIENLYREGLIWFEDGAGRWAWDLQAIQKRGVMANLVSLMAGKIETLAEETRRLLMIGACVGHEFGLGTVAAV